MFRAFFSTVFPWPLARRRHRVADRGKGRRITPSYLRPWPWDARGHAGGAEQAANPRGKRRDVVVRVFPSLSSMAFHGIFDFSMAMLNNQRKKQSD